MSEESREAQKKLWTDPAKTKLFVEEFPPIVGLDWGLGGLLIRDSTGEGGTYLFGVGCQRYFGYVSLMLSLLSISGNYC